MKLLPALLSIAALAAPSSAFACAPPPPGYVPPTDFQRLQSYVNGASDIVYGVVRQVSGNRSRFEILHVYKGSLSKADVVETTAGWDHPVPYCAGMSVPPVPKPVGTWGVASFRNGSPELSFVPMKDVRTMITEGWIRSAAAKR